MNERTNVSRSEGDLEDARGMACDRLINQRKDGTRRKQTVIKQWRRKMCAGNERTGNERQKTVKNTIRETGPWALSLSSDNSLTFWDFSVLSYCRQGNSIVTEIEWRNYGITVGTSCWCAWRPSPGSNSRWLWRWGPNRYRDEFPWPSAGNSALNRMIR